jgi:hypothetical protein
VKQRWDDDKDYRPKNLVDFLEKNAGWTELVT